ncbi:MAG TPA: hypothetical protein VIJ85_07665 [Rhizomicrobium sp.]
MRLFPIVTVLSVLLVASAAAADPMNGMAVPRPSSPPMGMGGGGPTTAELHRAKALKDLREEGIKLQQEDGGTLTDPHLDYLQQKLLAIQRGEYDY